MPTETGDINILFSHWTCIFSHIIDKHVPVCEMSVSDKYFSGIDRDLSNFMRTREKL